MPVSENAPPPHYYSAPPRPTYPTVVGVERGFVTSVRRSPLTLPIGVGCDPQRPASPTLDTPPLVRPWGGATLALAFLISLASGWAFVTALAGVVSETLARQSGNVSTG
jgi:hypothetical protein